jgi:Mg-chelatase subunit ChlD
MSRSTILATLAWLGAGLFACGAWLAIPRAASAAGAPTRIVLLDVSASTLGADTLLLATGVSARLRSIQSAARARGEDVIGIAFGRGARRFDLDAPLERQFARPEDASDLDVALLLAERAADERDVRGIDLIGDGTWTGVDPSVRAARLAARGIGIDRVDPRTSYADEAGILPLASPLRVRRGAPVAVEVEVWHQRGAPALRADSARVLVVTGVLTEGGRREERFVRVPIDGPPSANATRTLRVALDFGPLRGDHASLTARVDLEFDGVTRATGLAQDDVATAEITAADVLRVGVIGSAGARRSAIEAFGADLSNARTGTGLAGACVGLDAIPAPGSRGFDVLVTVDAALDAEDARRLDAWVAGGGGWIEFAGAGFAGGARPRAAALEPSSDDERPREIRVLLDASGSMAGTPARTARAALALLVERAPDGDGLSARWFSDEDGAAIDLGRPGERAYPERRRDLVALAARAPEPHGPTRIWSALEQLERSLDPAQRTLAILVSDGRDPDRADFAARAQAQRARLAARDAELAVVAVGADPDRELLAALAGGESNVLAGGELGDAGAIDRLAHLFVRTIANGPVVDLGPQRGPPIVHGRAGIAAPFVPFAGPVLARCVRARVVSRATPVWTIDTGRAAEGAASLPIFALGRHGLGLAGTFAFQPDSSWVALPNDLGAAVATAVRAVAPPPQIRELELRERDGDLVLEGELRGAPAVVHAELFAARDEPLGRVELFAARAGGDPDRERSAPLPSVFARLGAGEAIRVRIVDALAAGPIERTLHPPRAPEFALPPANFTAPRASAAAGAHPARGPHPAAPWALLAGLMALACAVGGGHFFRGGGRRT